MRLAFDGFVGFSYRPLQLASLFGAVVSVTGKVIKMRTDTVCIHGDTPGAVDIARGVRQALKDGGIEVAPFKRAS